MTGGNESTSCQISGLSVFGLARKRWEMESTYPLHSGR